MTLNMYGMITRIRGEAEVHFELDQYMEFHHWYDRHDLHAWMERLYYRKGGCLKDFRHAQLILTWADLDRLERRARFQEAMQTFLARFGIPHCADWDSDMRFIRQARKALLMGLNVVYAASW